MSKVGWLEVEDVEDKYSEIKRLRECIKQLEQEIEEYEQQINLLEKELKEKAEELDKIYRGSSWIV